MSPTRWMLLVPLIEPSGLIVMLALDWAVAGSKRAAHRAKVDSTMSVNVMAGLGIEHLNIPDTGGFNGFSSRNLD